MGVMLYQMGTGGLPFGGRDPLSVIAGIARGVFPRPSQLCATVGPDYERIVLRCLKTELRQRHPDAAALAVELRAFTREAALGDEGTALAAFLADPEAFEAKLRPRVADAAALRARQHARRGEFGRALAEIGRATAYVPGHAAAEALLRSLSARRRWLKVATGLVAVGAVGAAGWLVIPLVRPAATTVPAPTVAVAVAPPPPAPAPALAPAAQAAPSVVATAPRPRRTNPRSRAATAASPEPPAPAVVVAVPEPPPQVEPPEAPPTPAPAPVAAARVELTVRSAQGMCTPTLDDEHAPDRFLSVQTWKVVPGPHRVRCWQEGKPVFDQRLLVPAAAQTQKVIVRAPEGTFRFRPATP